MTALHRAADRGADRAGAATGLAVYVGDVGTALEPFLTRCAALATGRSTPFQSAVWLRAWYDSFGAEAGNRPLFVGVRHRGTGNDVMLLALVGRREAGLRVVRFADAGVVDYNLPRYSADWDAGAGDRQTECARALWRAVRQALHGHDVLCIDKMPLASLDGAPHSPNPLAMAFASEPCDQAGNEIQPHGPWDAWLAALGKRPRKEFERSWRVFTRSPTAAFERLTEASAALAVLKSLEAMQATRLQHLGAEYRLDRPAWQRFYREALTRGLADGIVVLTCLRDGPHIVAALYGVAAGGRCVAVRLATAGEAWKACSPGRLLLERTARHLFENGFDTLDLGIGDYPHKEMFDVDRIALVDACQALSWRGRAWQAAWWARRRLRRQAGLVSLVRRLRGTQRPPAD